MCVQEYSLLTRGLPPLPAVGLYVDVAAAKAAGACGGGEGDVLEKLASAQLVEKGLLIHLARDVDMGTLAESIDTAIRPRMDKTYTVDMMALDQFRAQLLGFGEGSLKAGTQLVFLLETDGGLGSYVKTPESVGGGVLEA